MHKIYIKLLLSILLQCNSFAEPLTLMSFNIRYDNSKDGENRWNLRKEHVAEVIREQQPDVIAIQDRAPLNYRENWTECEVKFL